MLTITTIGFVIVYLAINNAFYINLKLNWLKGTQPNIHIFIGCIPLVQRSSNEEPFNRWSRTENVDCKQMFVFFCLFSPDSSVPFSQADHKPASNAIHLPPPTPITEAHYTTAASPSSSSSHSSSSPPPSSSSSPSSLLAASLPPPYSPSSPSSLSSSPSSSDSSSPTSSVNSPSATTASYYSPAFSPSPPYSSARDSQRSVSLSVADRKLSVADS